MTLGSEYNGATVQTRAGGASLTDTVVDTLVRWPMRVTEATMDYVLQGVQRMTGSPQTNGADRSSTYESTSSSSSGVSAGSSWTSAFSGDQDLSGNDLKHVFWSIVFTKPGHETVLQPQQEELVNYSADANTYAATKIARLLDNARHGHVEKPAAWTNYPSTPSTPSTSSTPSTLSNDKGWRIPSEDQKYVVLLYRVERRLPRQQEVRRIEHITVERDTRVV
jgi:hypothetical protein